MLTQPKIAAALIPRRSLARAPTQPKPALSLCFEAQRKTTRRKKMTSARERVIAPALGAPTDAAVTGRRKRLVTRIPWIFAAITHPWHQLPNPSSFRAGSARSSAG